jgi:O-antigen/teichoic acid export membrane protein
MWRFISISATGTLVYQATMFLMLPVISKLYSTDEVGHFFFLGAIVSVVSPLATLRLEKALLSARDDSEVRRILAAALVCLAGLSLTASFTVVVASGWHPLLGQTPSLKAMIVLELWIVSLSVVHILHMQCVRDGQGGRIGISLAIRAVLFAVCAVMASRVFKEDALLAAMIGSIVLSGLICRPGRLMEALQRKSSTDTIHLSAIFKEHRSLIMHSVPQAALSNMLLNLPILVFGLVADAVVLAQVSLACRLCAAPAIVAGNALGLAFYSEAAKPQVTFSLLRTMLRIFAAVGLVLVAALVAASVLGPILTEPLFGSKWASTTTFFPLIAPAALSHLALQVWAFEPILTHRHRSYTLLLALWASLQTAALLGGGYLFGAETGLLAYSLVSLGTGTVGLLVSIRCLAAYFRHPDIAKTNELFGSPTES